jgi:hypothetical protein
MKTEPSPLRRLVRIAVIGLFERARAVPEDIRRNLGAQALSYLVVELIVNSTVNAAQSVLGFALAEGANGPGRFACSCGVQRQSVSVTKENP